PPSSDLLELADQLNSNPHDVLEQLKDIDFKERPSVDRTFANYLRALARFETGDHSKETLNRMRDAYRESHHSSLPASAQAEMARNIVIVLRTTESDWQRDPLLNDPRIQAALVEDVQ